MSDRWIVDLTVEPSDKTTEFDQVLHHRESVRKESKVLQKVDVHLDEEGLVYRKPKRQQQQQQQQQQFYYYLYKKIYTFAPQIARKLVMAGQAVTRTTLTKTSYHVNL